MSFLWLLSKLTDLLKQRNLFLQSIFNMIPAEDQTKLPEDENTPEKRAEKIWTFFGKKENGNLSVITFVTFHSAAAFTENLRGTFIVYFSDKITEGEFIQGVMDNKDILRLIQYDEPQRIKDKLKEKKQ